MCANPAPWVRLPLSPPFLALNINGLRLKLVLIFDITLVGPVESGAHAKIRSVANKPT
ncbi:hypothetical protein NBG4_630017 [Candidatus Sulfobium mesophilum]|uniref:Uncharacterized protein n=1 Tax=Candidatus Sulfobium mesophilum TaxID=2016548 RepID=A0A2U3QJT0_9BACT|nr:hypothetical protein NBG4_630017 [Candidatus Sulfobium mesophilum]